jgi:hypothetical protein
MLMNKYIMKTVSVNGTEVDFFNALKSFFTTNSVMPFTLESEKLTNTEGEANFIKLINDDYKLEIVSTAKDDASTSYFFTFKLYKNADNEVLHGTKQLSISDQKALRKVATARSLTAFLAKGDNIDFIYFGSHTASYGKGNGFYYIKSATTETGFIKAFAENSTDPFTFTDYETGGIVYNIAPYHTTSTATDTLIMDSELALKSKSNSFYCGTVVDCYGLGGGVKGMFYKDNNDTLLYCFESNACFKLEERVLI